MHGYIVHVEVFHTLDQQQYFLAVYLRARNAATMRQALNEYLKSQGLRLMQLVEVHNIVNLTSPQVVYKELTTP